MTAVVGRHGIRAVQVIVGVDTHKDEHVAVAVDQLGVRLGEHRVVTTTRGYAELEHWASGIGEIRAFGIEGTGSYGAGPRLIGAAARPSWRSTDPIDRPAVGRGRVTLPTRRWPLVRCLPE